MSIREAAMRDGVRIVPLTRSSADRNIGGAQIRILAPSPDYVPEETAKNNDSLVMEMSYGRQRVLLNWRR